MISSVSSVLLPAEQRVAKRYSLRNMEVFLNFDFAPRRRLRLVDHNVNGISVKVLKDCDGKALSWGDSFVLGWYRSFNLRQVCSYISMQAPEWAAVLANDDEKTLKLECHLAILERIVGAYNFLIVKRNPSVEPINFVNPLKRILRLQVRYPESLEPQQMKTVTHDISYDRLTSTEELSKLMQAALNKPLSIRFMGDKDLNNASKLPFTVNAIPAHIFKNIVQHPNTLNDPTTEPVRSHIQVVDVVYVNPDWSSIAANLHTQGQSEAMPRVYQQGIADGKQQGYQEAIAAIIAGFNKAVSNAK